MVATTTSGASTTMSAPACARKFGAIAKVRVGDDKAQSMGWAIARILVTDCQTRFRTSSWWLGIWLGCGE